MSRRRAIAALLALGTQAGSFCAAAQPQMGRAVRVVGYLSLEAAPQPYPTPEQWRSRSVSLLLRKSGWDEGRNLLVERAYAGLDPTRLDELAAGLVRKGVEVIVANGPEAALAAARASASIPVVSYNLVWPEEQGLIESFARPGRNVTGVSFYPGVEVSTKRMEILKELAPSVTRLAWLWPADYQRTLHGSAFDMVPRFESIAKSLHLDLRFYPVRSVADVDAALRGALGARAEALMASGEHAVHERQRVADFAIRHRLPSACPTPEMVEAGGLFSYALGKAELLSLYERSFEYVDRILRGAHAADLPVERPKRYELVLNLRTARVLGLAIPRAVALRAATLIE